MRSAAALRNTIERQEVLRELYPERQGAEDAQTQKLQAQHRPAEFGMALGEPVRREEELKTEHKKG